MNKRKKIVKIISWLAALALSPIILPIYWIGLFLGLEELNKQGESHEK